MLGGRHGAQEWIASSTTTDESGSNGPMIRGEERYKRRAMSPGTPSPRAPPSGSKYVMGEGTCSFSGPGPFVVPKGPRGEKRPADVIGNAVKVMRIATGEEEEELPDSAKSAAQELGARGGRARASRMTPERRAEIARKAANKRWNG